MFLTYMNTEKTSCTNIVFFLCQSIYQYVTKLSLFYTKD